MVFFDASEVFALVLLCPTHNQDKNYIFDDAKDPFVAPLGSHPMLVILMLVAVTERHTRRWLRRLVSM